MKKIRTNYLLIFIILCLSFFIGFEIIYNVSPQEGIYRFYKKITNLKVKVEVVSLLPHQNYGIINALDIIPEYSWNLNKDLIIFKDQLRPKLVETFGISISRLNKESKISLDILDIVEKDNIKYQRLYMGSYDGLKIPVIQFFPPKFNIKKSYPVIIVFSGHGSYNQVNFEKDSYQHAAALELAKEGYIVFTMENRGMGELSYLGDHLRIDAVARLTGGSWYGEIITDGLFLLETVYNLEYVDKSRIGVAGVSTGGGLSLFTAALDERIKAVYDQGYFGSYRTTFGTRANHCLCNNISGILNIADLNDIAGLIAPRDLLIVNGDKDHFFSSDAKKEFGKLKKIYTICNSEKNVDFKEPQGIGHEFSINIAIAFFNKVFK